MTSGRRRSAPLRGAAHPGVAPGLALPGAGRPVHAPARAAATPPSAARRRRRSGAASARPRAPATLRHRRSTGRRDRRRRGLGARRRLGARPAAAHARRRRRPDRLRAAGTRWSTPGGATATGGSARPTSSWSRWCRRSSSRRSPARRRSPAFRPLVHRFGERAPGSAERARPRVRLWLQPSPEQLRAIPSWEWLRAATSTAPGRARSSTPPGSPPSLERAGTLSAGRVRPAAAHAARHRGVDQRRGAARGRSATPTRSASATTTSPPTSARC